MRAIDIDADAIAECASARPQRYSDRVTFEVSEFDALEPESADLITAFDVLEHIPDDHGAVAALFRALRPGGTLLVHVPRDQWTTRDGTVHRVAAEEAWRINPGHVRMGYSPESMRVLLETAGFIAVNVETWLGRWGVLAHSVYARLERPAPLRLLSVPVTDACSYLDLRHHVENGNTVFAVARKV